MTKPISTLRKIQQWTVVLTLSLTECILWMNAMNGGIAKQPMLVFGSILLLALVLCEVFQRGNFEIPVSHISILVAAHALLFTISAVINSDALNTWNAFALGISCIVLFFAGTFLFSTKRELAFLLNSLRVLALFLCVVAVIQYFFPSLLPVDFFISRENRVGSLLGNSNYFGSYLILMFPVLLSQAIAKHEATNRRWIHYLLLASMPPLLLTTQARSAIIGFVVAMMCFGLLALEKKNARVTLSLFGIGVVGIVVWMFVVNPALGKRFATMFEENRLSTLSRRIYFWEGGKSAFLNSPFVGHGIGSFEQTIPQFRAPEYWTVLSEDVVPHAHNEIIEIATEYGAIGLLLFGATSFLLMQRGISISRKGNDWERWTAIGITSSLVAIAVDNLANVTLREAPIAGLTWLLMGIISSQVLRKDAPLKMTRKLTKSGVAATIPLALWACFAVLFVRHQLTVFASDVRVFNGVRLWDSKRGGEAIHDLRTALVLNPKNLYARSMLTLEYVRNGKWSETIAAADTLQSYAPLYPKSWLMKAYALLQIKRYDEALNAIDKELKVRNHPEAYDVQAMNYRARGNRDEERRSLMELMRKNILGKIGYQFRETARRIMQVSETEIEKQETSKLFDELSAYAPEERQFFDQLRLEMYRRK